MGSEQYHNHNTIFFRQYFDQQRDINTIFLQKMIHNVTSTIFFDKIETTIQHQWNFECELNPKMKHLYQFCDIFIRTCSNTEEFQL